MADPCMDPGASFHSGDDLFRLLVESVKDYAIFLLDPQGRVASWNAGAERIKGYRREEVLGQHFAHFNTVEDVRAGQCEQALAAATAAGHHEHEGWRVRKDGTRFWASVVLTALRDANGNLRGFGAVTRDLTARKRAEHSLACQAAALREQAEHLQRSQEMLQQLQQDLERRVDERTSALTIEIVERQRAEKALQEEAQRKDQFLAMLAHELRNPLAPIRTALEILRMPHAPRG
ncbi:MAG TPA: PAS domain S-box protein, partial [Gemmataceae bacterium]|nr:PAS domain S-box protein [Gemmataceae bacterium]